jgi:hypothetical protein
MRNRPWWLVEMFLMRYEHHLHIKKQSYPRTELWKPVSPVRYEHHLHIKKSKITS